MTSPRIVFAGTPEFARVSLQALVDAELAPVAVYTQPDRPSGRGRRLRASPVKQYALELGLPVLQPVSLRADENVADLAELKPDVMVVAAYGLLLPQSVLDLPRRGCVNVHASLLPRWRGAAPIQAAILAGDKQTGISLMQMDAGLDTGPVFRRDAINIESQWNAGMLHDALADLGGRMLATDIPSILDGEMQASPQDDALASYAGKIRTADARLDWQLTASDLHRRVRAYNPVPGARFSYGEEMVKCWQADVGAATNRPAGTVVEAGAEGITVACGSGSLRLQRLQRPGRKPVSAAEFAAQLDLRDQRFT